MKKSLIALAALAAVSAASAQSTVTLYGVVDGGYAYNGTNTTFVGKGVTSTPRIGFKGEEDLGGGLKALFVVETGLNSGKETATSIGDRGAFVGLAGSFGTVTMGSSQLNPSYYASAATNAVGADNYGQIKYAAGTPRNDNSVIYMSPKLFGGLVLRGAMVQKADNGNSAASDISAIYVNGPLTLAASAADNGFDKGTHVGAAYNFGMFTVFASAIESAGSAGKNRVADSTTTVGGALVTVPGSAAVAPTASFKYTNVGISAPVGAALVLSADYEQAKNQALNTDINTYMMSAKYSLSKRTTLTAYTKKAEKADTTFGFGVRHTF